MISVFLLRPSETLLSDGLFFSRKKNVSVLQKGWVLSLNRADVGVWCMRFQVHRPAGRGNLENVWFLRNFGMLLITVNLKIYSIFLPILEIKIQ